ncbi:MAG: 50S ribosomal protein L3 [Candidatus Paceibacterota bacterium]|jgi:large subunit ribosomal protein L3|nr:50S ribosomal protein L3 [Candidatus Paceibacterota bacterium]
MKYILGEKLAMTQIFTEDGVVHPVTAVQSGQMTVVQIKNKKKDGYDAVQYGYGVRNEKNINKAQIGHAKTLGNFRYYREERLPNEASVNAGDTFGVEVLKEGDVVEVSAISKGKGFQGVVKRHMFEGGRRSHGQKHSEREAGSIGGGGRKGGRVAKGMRMPGRMGSDRVTVKNLKIVAVDPETKQIFVSGAIPGRRGTLIEIKAR